MEQSQLDWKRFRAAIRLPDRHHAPKAPDRAATADAVSPASSCHPATDCLQQRLQANAALLKAAGSHLEWLSALLGEQRHAIALADADGVLLTVIGNWPEAQSLGLAADQIWSQDNTGESAIGAALARAEPVLAACQTRACATAPIRLAGGKTVGAIEISAPVAALDASLLLLAAHTAQIIGQALDTATRLAQAESLKLLALLSSFTAHELVAPLAATKTLLDLISLDQLPPKSASMVAAACSNTERLLQVVMELRILGGSHDRCFRTTHLPRLVEQAIAQAGLATVELDNALSARSTYIACNPGLLNRALLNLLRNAQDAVADSGRVGVRLEEADAWVRIVVWDTGPGIPPQHRHSLFEESFTTKPGGSGLGLLLVRAIVERVHEGRLRFEPNRPRGCRFQLWLPLPPA